MVKLKPSQLLWARPATLLRPVILFLALSLFLVSCEQGGDTGTPPEAPDQADRQFVRQGVIEVLNLYRTALLQEDIDRFQELFASEEDQASEDVLRFREAMAAALRQFTFIDLQFQDVQLSAESHTAVFREVETVEDPSTLERRTLTFHTTVSIKLHEDEEATASFRIADIRRDGPVIEVTTPGQILTRAPTRIRVTELSTIFPLAEVSVQTAPGEPETSLVASESFFHGAFIASDGMASPSLRVRVWGANGEQVIIDHPYRLRAPDEWVVQQIEGTDTRDRFFTVTVARDGTAWAGSRFAVLEENFSGSSLYKVSHETSIATFERSFDRFIEVEDLLFDRRERLHAVGFSEFPDPTDVQTTGVLVSDQDVVCQTVNIFDPDYPFLNLQGERSASTRALAAGERDIWLFGSDGGVARVADTFQAGLCPEEGAMVRYETVFRREESGLISNTVPALVTGRDGSRPLHPRMRIDHGLAFFLTPQICQKGFSHPNLILDNAPRKRVIIAPLI